MSWTTSAENVDRTTSEEIKDLYLHLLKQCLTCMLWDAKDGSSHEIGGGPRFAVGRAVRRVASFFQPLDPDTRGEGGDWPALAHTMVGLKRLDNVQECVEAVLRNAVPGDLIETGVWRGGVTILMRAVLKCYGVRDRKVWVADSFRGLPAPDPRKYPEDKGYNLSGFDSLAVSVEEVRNNFAKYGLLDHQVEFLAGWFKDTLPTAPIEKLAVLRLDGDLYESTIIALEHLYPKLSQGGFVIVDDFWNSPPCQKAIADYRRKNQVTEEIIRVDWSAAYWQKQN